MVDYVNYLVAKVIPPDFSYQKQKRFFAYLKHYYREEPILYKHCVDQVIRRCVLEDEMGTSYLVGDTLEARGQQKRYFNQVYTGLHCSRMCTSFNLLVISAKEWAGLPYEMNHPCAQF